MAWERRKLGPKITKKTSPLSSFVSYNESSLFFLSPPWPSTIITLITGFPNISSTLGSHHEPFSLLSAAPPIFFFSTSSATGHHHLSQSLLSHWPNIPSMIIDPQHLRWFSSIRCLFFLRQGRCIQNPFLYAAAK